jgi:hypothetical protein
LDTLLASQVVVAYLAIHRNKMFSDVR